MTGAEFPWDSLPNYPWAGCLASNLWRPAADWARCVVEAERELEELACAIDREWRVMVRDVRFALYGGTDSPERRRAYVVARLDERLRSLSCYKHRPECRALAIALERRRAVTAGYPTATPPLPRNS